MTDIGNIEYICTISFLVDPANLISKALEYVHEVEFV
jgi:hypothetical protein